MQYLPRVISLATIASSCFLGDNLIGESLNPIVQAFEDPSCSYHCRILLTPVENPSEFGVAELDALPTQRQLKRCATG